ncbi:hypothetical protein Pfo_029375 [Paulownia fortunei]|nr:hypothetical protein Pfo_029375 [Paulownia fortunei]
MATSVGYDRMKEVKEFDESKMGVKGLSDSGVSTIPRIFLHPRTLFPAFTIPPLHPSKSPSSTSPTSISIPVDRNIINHGIPVSVLDKTISAVKSFHEQPKEVKSKFYSREEMRGVMYASNNDLYRAEVACWHDSLQVWTGPEAAPAEEIPQICRNELLALGLELGAGKFKELTFSETRVMVGHIYPYCPQPDLTLGITPHTDPGIITVLLQNEIQGLQVKHGDEWVDVKPIPGGLIINIGDFLQIVSNGEYKSVQHRVLANSCREPRVSLVTFFNLTKWRESGCYGPLPELLTAEKPAIYRDFTIQEFHENFYSKGIDSKSLIEKIKL